MGGSLSDGAGPGTGTFVRSGACCAASVTVSATIAERTPNPEPRTRNPGTPEPRNLQSSFPTFLRRRHHAQLDPFICRQPSTYRGLYIVRRQRHVSGEIFVEI